MHNLAKWFLTPTKKQVIILTVIWLLSVFIIIFASTNNFSETPFQKKYYFSNILLALSFISITWVINNYLKVKSKQ